MLRAIFCRRNCNTRENLRMLTAGQWLRRLSAAALTGTLFFATVGCGDFTPPPKGAADKIKDAESAIWAGDQSVQKHDYLAAKSSYNSAKDILKDARGVARES